MNRNRSCSVVFRNIVGLFSALALGQFAKAESTSCYRFELQESVAMSAIPILSKQTWCYKSLAAPAGSTLIYYADQTDFKPELAAIVDVDGVVTHSSLIKGNLTNHRVYGADINPLPVPLSEPRHLTPLDDSEVRADEIKKVIETLQSVRAEIPDMRVQEGQVIASVPEQNLPWRGFWWSYKSNALAGSSNSPLAKYDRYVESRTGVSPRVASWERTYHKFKGIAWEGHCNGWAASAVLRAEPRTSRFHQPSGTVFTVGDQKGILAEEDYCAVVAFYGTRNYGKASNNPRDIFPADFHKVLTYYIGQLGKVVAMDYMSSRSVDNNLISGYTMDIVQKSADSYTVTAKLNMHKYDSSYSQPPGVAPPYFRTYKYTLQVDAAGNAVGGSWISANPDFLWVPLSPLDCSGNNQRMSQQFTSEIISLPPISR